MKRCKICRKKPRLKRRINSDGVLFCSDACYEKWEHPLGDYDHPYVNDYEMIRLDYMKWARSYEERLLEGYFDGSINPRYLIEELDEVIDEYYDYRLLEGRDGVYSEEIYSYLQKFEEIRETIQTWKIDDHKRKRIFKAMEREWKEKLAINE